VSHIPIAFISQSCINFVFVSLSLPHLSPVLLFLLLGFLSVML